MKRKHAYRNTYASLLATLLIGALLWSPAALAQDGRPDPASPASQAGEEGGRPQPVAAGEEGDAARHAGNGAPGRRVDPDGTDLVKLAFDDVGVKETIPFIAEMTGKVVMPVNLLTLQNKKITLMNDEPIEKARALDMLFQAFRLNQVGVIEKEDVVIIGNLDEIVAWRLVPVLTADVNIMDRQDKGTLVLKIFQVKEVAAEDIGDLIGENLPSHATLSVDANSNQIVVYGDIALCQHLQEVILELDHTYIEPKTQTFRLAYADATEISENILDLFEDTGTTRTGGDRRQTQRGPTGRRGPQPVTGVSPIGPEIELRVTVNVQQNSVTVTGDPTTVEKIGKLIADQWDLPRSPGTAKIYTLIYTDPLKVADKLNALLGQGGGTSGGRRTVRPGGQGGAGVEEALSGIFRIEAYPDTSQLLVFSKTKESLNFLDEVIESLDQPTTIGLPFVVELKHASAVELAEQLNALLAEAGSGATIRAPEEGLTGQSISEMSGGTSSGQSTTGQAGTLNFPWQRGGRQREDQSPESPLIGKVRIVPIIRQNALAILCPRPQQEAVNELISFFDRPGRQVMISVIIAEISLTDDLVLGWRLSSSDDVFSGANSDFRVGGSVGIEGQEENPFRNLFDTSLLNANVSLNLVIQALQQKSDLRVIQQPVVFTADNQEAFFFDGQEIPFITQTTINSQGNPTDSFDYKEVGVILNVRPRITVQRDVDMELRLELSATVPGVTLFGGAIIDKRLTTTHVIVQNGQTVVLSGILRERESKITRGIPLLSDIPLIGELFKHRENTTTQVELLAFVTPYVVDNPQESGAAQSDYLHRLDEMLKPIEQQRRDRKDVEGRIEFQPPPEGEEERPRPEPAEEADVPVDVDDLNLER